MPETHKLDQYQHVVSPIVRLLPQLPFDFLRWSRIVGQFDGPVKLGSGCRQAANFSMPEAQYASSGV